MNNEKRSSHPELYIMLTLGIKPDILIKKGYSKVTVYSYNRKVIEIRNKLTQLLDMETASKK